MDFFFFFSIALKVVNNSRNIKKCTIIWSQGRCISERLGGFIQRGGSKITAAKSFFLSISSGL